MGDWSMLITLSSPSMPEMFLCFPGTVLARFKSLARRLYKISFTRELFPEPETPVTQVITPTGIFTEMPLRLFSLAPVTASQPLGCRRWVGTGTCILPLKYWPVTDSATSMISCAVPWAITFPPWEPAPGPISTTWSASSIVSSSCSTTISVLPRSRRFFRVLSSLSLSLWCRPMLGSSRI